ncbi:MAG: VOC family protein [Pseudomonadota bacterium]
MGISALGYLGVRSDKLEDWSSFASGLLGMQEVDRGGRARSFRMDDRKQRFVVSGEAGDALAFMGWEVDDADNLDALAAKLDNVGVRVTYGSAAFADQRFVDRLIYFDDPAGNRIELFHGSMVDSTPFRPGRAHSGFVTGAFGLGHAVLHVQNVDQLLPFYRDLLGFGLSDFGLEPVPAYFFHVNQRHHSFALIGSGRHGFHHFMVEYGHLDDVGQGYDLALQEQDRIAYTLGRHTNDWMTSYYAHTPSGFFVESGWGGRIIDPATWVPKETHDGPSFWGHDRLYMSEQMRSHFRDLRMNLAAAGERAPPLVDCPWLYQELNKTQKT